MGYSTLLRRIHLLQSFSVVFLYWFYVVSGAVLICRQVAIFEHSFPPIKTMAASDLSKKVEESITNAKEVCAEDPVSGECATAWDEVEEVSAAASDEMLKKKKTDTDPLETYCNDNPIVPLWSSKSSCVAAP